MMANAGYPANGNLVPQCLRPCPASSISRRTAECSGTLMVTER
jgi:hypothetical protein